MTDEHAPEPTTEEPEQATETRKVKQLIGAGYVRFLRARDGYAIVDSMMPVYEED